MNKLKEQGKKMTDSFLNVMIVDDEESIRLNLEVFLEDEDFNIYATETGEEALKVASEVSIDVGIIDMRLPDIDGQALIIELHKNYPKMKFLIHTGSIDYVLPRKLVDLGIKERQILHKPVNNMDSLVATIKRVAGDLP